MEDIIYNLKNRMKNSFFHMTGSKEEKNHIRANGCTYITKNSDVAGYKIAVIKDKKTGEKITLPIYRIEAV